jgi:ubiquinone/menaquinone biosynthesis C-methylase UbiE
MKKENYWDELCGTAAWNALGLKEVCPSTLEIFNRWYLDDFYPYLAKYLGEVSQTSNILEIGLGFGTVGQYMFNRCTNYTGVDFAQGPVGMMNQRIEYCCKKATAIAVRGDARNLEFEDETFDYVISIGCLHHTGDLKKSIDEVYCT